MTVVIRCSATSVGLGVVEHDVFQANHECLQVIEPLHELGNARVIVHERFEFAAGRDIFLAQSSTRPAALCKAAACDW